MAHTQRHTHTQRQLVGQGHAALHSPAVLLQDCPASCAAPRHSSFRPRRHQQQRSLAAAQLCRHPLTAARPPTPTPAPTSMRARQSGWDQRIGQQQPTQRRRRNSWWMRTAAAAGRRCTPSAGARSGLPSTLPPGPTATRPRAGRQGGCRRRREPAGQATHRGCVRVVCRSRG